MKDMLISFIDLASLPKAIIINTFTKSVVFVSSLAGMLHRTWYNSYLEHRNTPMILLGCSFEGHCYTLGLTDAHVYFALDSSLM